ncbi:type II toxin-antitoxin system HicA family toxin [Spirosoma foliorum]|uniref:Type II toxin-antitoxin system HicA family toxin n=1 Tax=Spirosoma foliorum TaxID=2710596 RepID=A0A7G5H7N5_9BACT|nr:type II toxin-antitoxin system HicA family toxin [Spirosoma foliorum]
MKFREIVRLIEEDGWYQVRQRGSHRQFKHTSKTGLVTIAYHSLNDSVPSGTLSSIYKQAQIER